jgi:hypothetical protein
MGIWERIRTVDRRVLYTLILAAEMLVVIRPLGLPMQIDAETRLFHSYIQDLPDGSIVAINMHWSAGAWGEDQALAEAQVYHLLSRPVKVIAASVSTAASAVYVEDKFTSFVERYFPDRVYGEDWVFLGYVPVSEVAYKSFFSDIRGTYPSDYQGTSIDALSIMDGITDGSDCDLFIQARSTLTDTEYIVRQFYVPYGAPNNIPYIQWDASFNVASEMPYRNAGQVSALLMAATGGPQYELLIGRPSVGAMMSDMISSTHILFITFVVIGNLAYFMTREREVT